MRVRREAERAVLDEAGGRIVVHALTGTPDAATIERVARAVTTGEPADWHVFDLRRVRHVEPAAVRIATMLAEQLRAAGAHVVVVPPTGRANRQAVAPLSAVADKEAAQLDDALRWCEDELLLGMGLAAEPADALVPLHEQDLLAGLAPDTIAAIEATSITRVFAAGAPVFSAGQPADGLYFIGAGQVSAVIEQAGSRRRLRMMGAGSSFGELALVEGGTRSATIVADDATLCYVLTVDAFEKLVGNDPAAAAELCRAIAASLATRLRAATIEIQALERRI
jgi:glutaminase